MGGVGFTRGLVKFAVAYAHNRMLAYIIRAATHTAGINDTIVKICFKLQAMLTSKPGTAVGEPVGGSKSGGG